MNHDTHDNTHDLPDTLRWQLRALRRDEAPTTDLWPGIAQRLATPTPASSRPTQRWRMPAAMAASVLVAVGTLGLLHLGGPSTDGPSSPTRAVANAPGSDEAQRARPGVAHAPLVLAEAEGLRRQYQGAIRELEARPGTAATNPTLHTLDQSAELILAALRQTPDSTRLLEQLRRTYQRRLDLMRLPLA